MSIGKKLERNSLREEQDPTMRVLDEAAARIRAAHKEIGAAYEEYHKLIDAFYAGVSKGGTYNTYYTETSSPIKQQHKEQ